jgi:hypothetical protein
MVPEFKTSVACLLANRIALYASALIPFASKRATLLNLYVPEPNKMVPEFKTSVACLLANRIALYASALIPFASKRATNKPRHVDDEKNCQHAPKSRKIIGETNGNMV